MGALRGPAGPDKENTRNQNLFKIFSGIALRAGHQVLSAQAKAIAGNP